MSSGTLEFTMYLEDRSSCREDDECLSVCKDQAKDPSVITRSKCMKFVGNVNQYCCCYGCET